jgi:hypothetical protein
MHGYPIVISNHASKRLGRRFQLVDDDEIKYYIRSAKVVVPFGKDGSIGKLRCNLGDKKIVFVCTISEKCLVVITVEEG